MMKVYFLLLIFSLSSLVNAKELLIVSENSPPFNYLKENQFQGPAVDIIKELQKRTQQQSEIEVLP